MKPLVWMRRVRDADLPAPVLFTALAIGLRADVHGNCWPSYAQIAADVGTDRRHVIRRVNALREAGWLMVAPRANGHGSQSNSYILTVPHLWTTEAGGGSQATPLVAQMTPPSGSRATPQGVAHKPPRRGTPKEVSTPRTAPAVDNRHLNAVISQLGRATRIP